MIGLRHRLVAALMPALMTALMTAALRPPGIVVAARLALMARLMGLMALLRLMGLLARLVARIVLRLMWLVGLLRLMRLVHLMRLVLLMIRGAAVARPGDEGRQIVLDVVGRGVGRPRRPVILLKAPAADLARAVRRQTAAAVAAAPRAAMQARLRFREALTRLRVAAVGLTVRLTVGFPGIAHPALAGAAIIRITARATRRISFVGHRLSLSLCASRRITMGYGKE